MKLLVLCCVVGITLGELNEDVVRDVLAGHPGPSSLDKRAVLSSASMAVKSMAKSFASNVGLAQNSGLKMSSGFNKQFTDSCLGSHPTPSPILWRQTTPWWYRRTTQHWWIPKPIPIINREAKKLPNRDYVFVLDTSGSILGSQFLKAKEGIATLVESFCPSSLGSDTSGRGTKQVAVVLFGSTTTLEISFTDSHKGLSYLRDKILNIKHRRDGKTSTAKALKYVKENVIGRGASRVFDSDVSTDVFVITDGRCNDECYDLGKDSDNIRSLGHGVNVFALGVSDARNCELEIVSGKGDSLAYGLGDFQEFDKFAVAVDEIAKENSSKCA